MAALLSEPSMTDIAQEDRAFLGAPGRQVVLAFEAGEPHGDGRGHGARAEGPAEAQRPVGFAAACQGPQPWELQFVPDIAPEPELVKLYTLARTHGTGLGSALLEAVAGVRGAVYLWIMSGNARAERFYRKHGFREVGPRFAAEGPWAGQETFRMRRD